LLHQPIPRSRNVLVLWCAPVTVPSQSLAAAQCLSPFEQPPTLPGTSIYPLPKLCGCVLAREPLPTKASFVWPPKHLRGITLESQQSTNAPRQRPSCSTESHRPLPRNLNPPAVPQSPPPQPPPNPALWCSAWLHKTEDIVRSATSRALSVAIRPVAPSSRRSSPVNAASCRPGSQGSLSALGKRAPLLPASPRASRRWNGWDLIYPLPGDGGISVLRNLSWQTTDAAVEGIHAQAIPQDTRRFAAAPPVDPRSCRSRPDDARRRQEPRQPLEHLHLHCTTPCFVPTSAPPFETSLSCPILPPSHRRMESIL
jgi:hypothetical protein